METKTSLISMHHSNIHAQSLHVATKYARMAMG